MEQMLCGVADFDIQETMKQKIWRKSILFPIIKDRIREISLIAENVIGYFAQAVHNLCDDDICFFFAGPVDPFDDEIV